MSRPIPGVSGVGDDTGAPTAVSVGSLRSGAIGASRGGGATLGGRVRVEGRGFGMSGRSTGGERRTTATASRVGPLKSRNRTLVIATNATANAAKVSVIASAPLVQLGDESS